MSALIAAAMALSTCATLDEEECLTADWSQLGQADGAAGQPSSHIERHREACAKHGLPVNDQQWHAGWQIGIRLYCTPQNGLQVGRDGRSYANSCPADMAAEFSHAYQVGQRVFEARRELNEARSKLDEVLRDMRDAKDEDRQRLTIEAEMLRTRVFGAEIRVQSAEAAYDRYLTDLTRGI
jgi:hypothetical protein